jgi:hypothetical protein
MRKARSLLVILHPTTRVLLTAAGIFLLLSSCSLQKRRYRPGYELSFHSPKHHVPLRAPASAVVPTPGNKAHHSIAAKKDSMFPAPYKPVLPANPTSSIATKRRSSAVSQAARVLHLAPHPSASWKNSSSIVPEPASKSEFLLEGFLAFLFFVAMAIIYLVAIVLVKPFLFVPIVAFYLAAYVLSGIAGVKIALHPGKYKEVELYIAVLGLCTLILVISLVVLGLVLLM